MTHDFTNINGFTGVFKEGVKKEEIFAFVLGAIVLSVSAYSVYLSIKANKLTIRKFKDDGYE